MLWESWTILIWLQLPWKLFQMVCGVRGVRMRVRNFPPSSGKTRYQVQSEIKAKERAQEVIARMYANHVSNFSR